MASAAANTLINRRIEDAYSCACYLVRHLPSLVAASDDRGLRVEMNSYLDLVRENADAGERNLKEHARPIVERPSIGVPDMIDDLYDALEIAQSTVVSDLAIAAAATQTGGYEAAQYAILAQLARRSGQSDLSTRMTASSDRLAAQGARLWAALG